MYSGSGLSVSAMDTEMGTCSLSKERFARRAGSLRLVLVRLEVVDNRVGSLRLLIRAAGGCQRDWGFVFPLFNHGVTSVAELLGSHQSEPISNLPCECPAPVQPYHLLSLVGSGVALLCNRAIYNHGIGRQCWSRGDNHQRER